MSNDTPHLKLTKTRFWFQRREITAISYDNIQLNQLNMTNSKNSKTKKNSKKDSKKTKSVKPNIGMGDAHMARLRLLAGAIRGSNECKNVIIPRTQKFLSELATYCDILRGEKATTNQDIVVRALECMGYTLLAPTISEKPVKKTTKKPVKKEKKEEDEEKEEEKEKIDVVKEWLQTKFGDDVTHRTFECITKLVTLMIQKLVAEAIRERSKTDNGVLNEMHAKIAILQIFDSEWATKSADDVSVPADIITSTISHVKYRVSKDFVPQLAHAVALLVENLAGRDLSNLPSLGEAIADITQLNKHKIIVWGSGIKQEIHSVFLPKHNYIDETVTVIGDEWKSTDGDVNTALFNYTMRQNYFVIDEDGKVPMPTTESHFIRTFQSNFSRHGVVSKDAKKLIHYMANFLAVELLRKAVKVVAFEKKTTLGIKQVELAASMF